jgi:hypothetical protein
MLYIRSELYTTAEIWTVVFWAITSCSLVDGYQHSREDYHLHLWDRSASGLIVVTLYRLGGQFKWETEAALKGKNFLSHYMYSTEIHLSCPISIIYMKHIHRGRVFLVL